MTGRRNRSIFSGWLWTLCVFWACFVSVPLLRAQPVESVAYNKVQAAYIYKIASFVTWPEVVDAAAFTICIVEKEGELASILNRASAGRNIQQLPLEVLSLSSSELSESPEVLERCRLVYLHDQSLAEVVDELTTSDDINQHALWISSPDVQVHDLVLFELAIENDRIVIYINRKRMTASELVVEAPLLAVARPR